MKKLLSVLAVLAFSASAQSQTIVTVAGTGTAGYSGDGAAATSAMLNKPYGVCMDSMGNFFIGDYGNNRIRKVTPSGVITTLAGTGTAGFNGDGLDATLTQLNGPYGMSVNQYGSIIISDRNNHRLRIIQTESGGVIYTIAGTGVPGFSGDGGPATSAQVNHPQGAFRDKMGNVYFCDDDNSRVRKIDASGIISTIAGNGVAGYGGDGGPATAAMLYHPAGVSKDTAGNIYIAEFQNHVIRKVSPSGIISTICGNGTSGFSGDGGPASAALISYPKDVHVDPRGNILFSDGANQRLRKITPDGIIHTIAGNGVVGYAGDGGPATSASFNWLQGVFVANQGDIYIGDCLNHRIRKIICTPPTVSAITGADSVCKATSTTLASITAGGTWQSSNAHATVSATGVVTGVTPGIDTITYVVENECTWASATHVIRVTACTNGVANTQLPIDAIYPNPASDELNVESGVIINDVAIVNTVGQVVYSGTYVDFAVRLDIHSLTPGVYCLKINGVPAGRFVKQ